MIKVLLVDDHELIRTAIEVLLNANEDLQVESACGSGEEALAVVDNIKPDIILMDLKMPGMGGEEACRRILKNNSDCKIIALSVFNDAPAANRLARMGVRGFISKGSSVDETVKAIRCVMSGEQYFCSELLDAMSDFSFNQESHTPFDKLSHREAQVMNLILKGKNIQEISSILVISDKTVSTYRYRLYDKLNVKNDVELMLLAIKFNRLDTLTPPPSEGEKK